jgi:hypothetical protein
MDDGIGVRRQVEPIENARVRRPHVRIGAARGTREVMEHGEVGAIQSNAKQTASAMEPAVAGHADDRAARCGKSVKRVLAVVHRRERLDDVEARAVGPYPVDRAPADAPACGSVNHHAPNRSRGRDHVAPRLASGQVVMVRLGVPHEAVKRMCSSISVAYSRRG